MIWTTAHVEVFDVDQCVLEGKTTFTWLVMNTGMPEGFQHWHLKNLTEFLAHFKQWCLQYVMANGGFDVMVLSYSYRVQQGAQRRPCGLSGIMHWPGLCHQLLIFN